MSLTGSPRWADPLHQTAPVHLSEPSKPKITCSMLKIEALEQGVKYAQS